MTGLELRMTMRWATLTVFGSLLAATQPTLVYTEAPQVNLLAESRGGERFPSGAVLHILSGGKDTILIPGFAASADACVSFDGKRVLFSAKPKAADRWQIWEVAVAGGAPRRIIEGNADAITPFYLPGDRIVFAWGSGARFELRTAALATGKEMAPLTFGAVNARVADVLRDGRVLFTAPHAGIAAGGADLFTVYTDGSGVETHRCDHTHARRGAHELASGDIVFETGGHLARFTPARAVELPLKPPAGEFAAPVVETDNGALIAAYRAHSSGTFGLYRWNAGKDELSPVVAAKPGVHAVQPVAVTARAVPKKHPSSLGNREGANLLCLSVYTSKLNVPANTAASVRVWMRDGRSGQALALGEAPVAADGSFFVQAPSDRPIRFEVLDRTGRTIAAEKGWWWARTGEQRICTGCHAGPERAAENAVPEILTHSTDPTRLIPGGGQATAASGGAK